MNKKRLVLQKTLLAATLSGLLISTTVFAAWQEGESIESPTIKGYAPYLKSVGSRFVGKDKGEVFIGDIIEVPTSAFSPEDDSPFYSYRDGNGVAEDAAGLTTPAYLASQDLDKDNNSRVRQGSLHRQKVSVRWYILAAKENKDWADNIYKAIPGNETADFNDFNVADLNTAAYDNAVKSWADVTIVQDLAEETYYVPMADDSTKSLALRVPPEAYGYRVGFIIVPESETGDPARGNPLKVPDLNFFWQQNPNTQPGDVCDISPSDPKIAEECNTNPGTPSVVNPDNGGGFVKLRQYLINIRWSQDGTGIPRFDEQGRPIDPILGTTAAPFPYVNEVYYPEISILTKDVTATQGPEGRSARGLALTSNDFRLLTLAEQETITWEFAYQKYNDLSQELEGNEQYYTANFGTHKGVVGDYTYGSEAAGQTVTDTRFIVAACNQADLDAAKAADTTLIAALGGLSSAQTDPKTNATYYKTVKACNPYSSHGFKLQLNNTTAQQFWENVRNIQIADTDNFITAMDIKPFGPMLSELQEQSEQRMKLKVKFRFDDTNN